LGAIGEYGVIRIIGKIIFEMTDNAIGGYGPFRCREGIASGNRLSSQLRLVMGLQAGHLKGNKSTKRAPPH